MENYIGLTGNFWQAAYNDVNQKYDFRFINKSNSIEHFDSGATIPSLFKKLFDNAWISIFIRLLLLVLYVQYT